jgi:RHS repeat-associated protein
LAILHDQTGTTAQVIKRDVWGTVSTNSFDKDAVTNTEIGYTGHRFDSDSNLTYAHARYLSNQNRVWLSEDPFALNNFSSDVFLLNPQIQNTYSYATNDPVNKLDPDGKIPTWQEAGAMANDIYDPGNRSSIFVPNSNLNGWNLDKVISGGDNMRMGVYSKTVNGKLEYALVNKGTQTFGDWVNNFEQPGGISDDAIAAIELSHQFMLEHPGVEVTAIGHSKGGAEAQLVAVKNNINAMVFNSSFPNFYAYGLYEDYVKYDKKKIQQRVVDGEILNAILGGVCVRIGETKYLPFTDLTKPMLPNNIGVSVKTTTSPVSGSLSPFGAVNNIIANHYMGTVNLVNK